MTSQLPAGYSVVEDTEQAPSAPQATSTPALPPGYRLVQVTLSLLLLPVLTAIISSNNKKLIVENALN